MAPAEPALTAAATADRSRVARLGLALGAAALPALVDPGAIGRAAALFPHAAGPRPWWVPEAAALLYGWAPLVALSAFALVLAPGLGLALALGAGRCVGEWLLAGLALSLVAVSASVELFELALGGPLRGRAFGILVAALAAACWALARRRAGTGRAPWPLAAPHARLDLALAVAVPFALVAVLAPKVHWENFNGDGMHAFESSRLLLHGALPFFDPTAGKIAQFPGVTSMLFAFPGAWFLRLFGELEASARLPYFAYLVAVAGGVLALAEHGRAGRAGALGRIFTWTALAVYTLVMAWSATYSPYCADLALPGTQDTLLVAVFLGFALAFARGAPGWMALYLVLAYVSLPSGVLLVGFLWVAAWLVLRPRPWRALLLTAAGVVLCSVGAGLFARACAALGVPPPGGEYGLRGLIERFRELQFTEARRLAFAALPTGLVPFAAALAIAAHRRADRWARALALVALVYFAFFFVQASVSLHHFVPAMLVPLAALARLDPPRGAPARAALAAALLAGVCTSVALSWPEHLRLYTGARQVGAEIEDRAAGYATARPEALARAELLTALFPYGWDPRVPAEIYGDSPLLWNHYAHRAPHDASPAYVLAAEDDPAPPGGREVARGDGAALWVLDEDVLAAQRVLRPPFPPGARIYRLPRWLLFRQDGARDGTGEPGPRVVRPEELLEWLGIDPAAWKKRLGLGGGA